MEEKTVVNLYGDSILRGTVIDEKLRYHSTVPEILSQLASRYDIQFLNRARFGSTVEKGSGILEKDVQQGLACNYAVVEFGGNDCSFAWSEVAADPGAEHQPATLPERFCQMLQGMVERLRKKGATPVLMTLPPVDAEKHLQFIGKDEKARRNILSWLGDAHMIYRFHELYSNIIEKIAKQTKAILVDVRGRFLVRHDLKRLVGLDGIHLNREGYDIVGQVFADFIEAHRREPERLVFE